MSVLSFLFWYVLLPYCLGYLSAQLVIGWRERR